MGDFTFDMREIEDLELDLQLFAEKALPHAARNALNAAVFAGRKQWIRHINLEFTVRNKFIPRSIRVVKARGNALDDMEAELGSTEPAMALQEDGGTVRGKSGGAFPIPTSVAGGQAMGTRPRKKVVRRPLRQPNIKLKATPKGASRKQRNAIAISEAVRSGRRFVLLNLDTGKGIFRVTGRKRIRVRMIWDLSRTSVRVPPSPTLEPTLEVLQDVLPELYKGAIIDQLKRRGVLGF